jgi:L-asparagine transporter-like permease
VTALAVSSAGMVAALVLARRYPESAYLYMVGAAFFGGLFVWVIIFVTHFAFRRRHRGAREGPVRFAPRGPWSSLVGLAALTAVLVSTWWIPGMRITLVAGLPWLVFISLCYLLWRARRRRRPVTS